MFLSHEIFVQSELNLFSFLNYTARFKLRVQVLESLISLWWNPGSSTSEEVDAAVQSAAELNSDLELAVSLLSWNPFFLRHWVFSIVELILISSSVKNHRGLCVCVYNIYCRAAKIQDTACRRPDLSYSTRICCSSEEGILCSSSCTWSWVLLDVLPASCSKKIADKKLKLLKLVFLGA
jgi:hypothetical protein